MNPQTHKDQSALIVYDADSVQQPGKALFDPSFWERRGGLQGTAEGRGSALLLETDFGSAVLKHYLRGGWVARFSRDRYLFTGPSRARPIAEFRTLLRLAAAGLPVPQPLAALCDHSAIFYRGALLTRRIMPAETFAERFGRDDDDAELWRRVGACIRRFHDYGVVHADLNARNILVGGAGEVHLIDFDRARFRPGSRAFRANLARLQRSIKKLWPKTRSGEMSRCWQQLLAGYAEPPASKPAGAGERWQT